MQGLSDTLRRLQITSEQIDQGIEQIVQEVAIEMLNEGVENVNGSNTAYNTLPYPVRVITGTLKRSLKVKKISKHKWEVFADPQIANYAWWIHEGTSKMEARPFLDDAKNNVIETEKYLEIAHVILNNILGRGA